jgi:FKBP-type peptidyl-prolyl cis-trans isomerase (trigger factor)
MRKFIFKPDITLYSGVQVNKDTVLEYKNENVDQKLENLQLVMTTYTKENNYEARSNLTFHLNEGDILLFDEEVGYQVPRIPMSTLKDALMDLESIQDFDKEG